MPAVTKHRQPAVRFALLALAAIGIAWFVVGAIQTHAQSEASSQLGGRTGITPTEEARIFHLLDRAGFLNPDETIEVLRGETEVQAGQRPAAERRTLQVVRREPDNISAWILLEIAAVPRDPATERLAVQRQRELAPPVPAAP